MSPQSDWHRPPTVSGSARIGQTLSASPGTGSGDPTSFSYQWYDCAGTFGYTPDAWANSNDGCAPITDATDSTYTLQDSDHGYTILAEVTATNGQGQTVVDSATTSAVVDPPPTNTTPPTISDRRAGFSPGDHPLTGDTLTTDGDSWTGDTSGGVSYQWEDCDTNGLNCQPISGATDSQYKVRPTDIGSTIALDMTATNVDGLSTDALSPATATVPSSDADLSGLTLSAGTLAPSFAAGSDSYAVSVPNATGSLDVTPSVDEAHATVTVNGETVASGARATQSLNAGANTITVVVTAQDNTTTHAYTLTVTRAPSADADLSGLTVSVGTLAPSLCRWIGPVRGVGAQRDRPAGCDPERRRGARHGQCERRPSRLRRPGYPVAARRREHDHGRGHRPGQYDHARLHADGDQGTVGRC